MDRQNRGARILVLAGVENCAQLLPALDALPQIRLVDMEQRLRRQGHG